MNRMYTLAEIAEHIHANVYGDPHCQINGIATLQSAQAGQITFLDNSKYRRFLPQTKASAVILTEGEVESCPANALVMSQPYVGYAKAAQLFMPKSDYAPGIHPTAIIGEGCEIHPSASIGPYTVIGKHAQIAEQVIIAAHCTLGNQVRIGKNSRLHARVTIYDDCQIGESVELHSGVVIGADGFGLANDNGQWLHVPQIGSVIIGNAVSIGANTTIDRGTIGDTIIHDGVKLDNQIQIAHNVEIGAHTAVAACSGISGSTKIGQHCLIAGGVGIAGHLTITDRVVITAMTGVSHSISEPGMYSSGIPALPNREWRRNAVTLKSIDKLVKRINSLESLINNKT